MNMLNFRSLVIFLVIIGSSVVIGSSVIICSSVIIGSSDVQHIFSLFFIPLLCVFSYYVNIGPSDLCYHKLGVIIGLSNIGSSVIIGS